LVQAIFIELTRFDSNDWFQNVPAQSKVLATNGKFDDTLAKWIMAFQQFYAVNFAGSVHIKTDGIIDPLPAASSINVAVTFKSGRTATLSLMCNRLWKWDKRAYLAIGDAYRIPWIPEPAYS
jgi:hypothetical protein